MKKLALVAVVVLAGAALAQSLQLRRVGLIIPTDSEAQWDAGTGVWLTPMAPYAIQCDNTCCFRTINLVKQTDAGYEPAAAADCARDTRLEAHYLFDFELSQADKGISVVCYKENADGGCGAKIFSTNRR